MEILFCLYTADLGGGSSGNLTSSLRIGSGTAPVPVFTASLSQQPSLESESHFWLRAASLEKSVNQTINRLESVPKQVESRYFKSSYCPQFGRCLWTRSSTWELLPYLKKGSHITERFSGAFIGGDLNFFLDCFEASLGYRYSFGSSIPTLSMSISNKTPFLPRITCWDAQ